MAYTDDQLPTDAADAKKYAEAAIDLWTNRNQRMALDERAWAIPEPEQPNRLQLSDAHAQIEAANQLMADADMTIRAIAHDDPSRAPAQAVEDWCRALRTELDRRHRAAGLGAWTYNLCWSLNTRGWVVPRVLWNPADPVFPFQIDLLDPMEVYPCARDAAPDCIVHQYVVPLRRLRREWGTPRVNELLDVDPKNDGADLTYEVTAFYTPTEFAVLVDGTTWLKRPVAHGYGQNPVACHLATGLPFRQESTTARALRGAQGLWGAEGAHGWALDVVDRWVGTSLIHAIRIHERDSQAIANLNMELLRGAARPPTASFTQDGRLTDLKELQKPNSTASLRVGEAIGRYPPDGAALQYGLQMAQRSQGNIYQAGLNQAVMGDIQNVQSGFHATLFGEAGVRVLQPRMACLVGVWEWLFGTALRLFSRFGFQAMPYLARDRSSGTIGLQRIAPWMLFDADYGLTVQFGTLGLPDVQQMAMVATQLLDRSVVSQEWALDNLLHIDNPTQVIQQARRDQFYKDPAMLRLRVLLDKAQDTTDPVGAQLAQMMFQKVFRDFTIELSTPPQQPQQPPLPGSGTPSAPGTPGPANNVLPDELALAAGQVPNAGAPPGVASPAAGIPALAGLA